jgi:tetrahydromethanopterin S-methyltransferase subunit G
LANGSLEERVARIEGILEQMDKRLNHIESDLASIRGEMAGLRDEMNRRFDSINGEMNRRFDSLFRWAVGLILGMWTTTMMTLIPILLRVLGAI